MVVFKVYLARSITGRGVAVGVIVAVGKGVIVAVDVGDAVGVAVGVGASDEQEEIMNANRKRLERVVLFRMGCILPLVA
jgi:hypothetical protein